MDQEKIYKHVILYLYYTIKQKGRFVHDIHIHISLFLCKEKENTSITYTIFIIVTNKKQKGRFVDGAACLKNTSVHICISLFVYAKKRSVLIMTEFNEKEMEQILNPDVTKYLLLRKVSMNFGTNLGTNEQEELTVDADGLFFSIKGGGTQVKFGRNKASVKKQPVGNWSEYVCRRLDNGWVIISTEKLETKEIKMQGEYKIIEDSNIREILDFLLLAANEALSETYSVQVDNVPQKDLDAAQELINKLNAGKTTLSVSEFNRLLMELWTIIPRPIRQMKKEMVMKSADFEKKVQAEQELLDFLNAMLKTETGANSNKNILEANNLKMQCVTDTETLFIKDMMADQRARYIRAWKCTNEKTEKAFNDYCKSRNLSEENGGVTKLFHGSGTPNWWSIFLNGLYLNPSLVKADVPICGKMFGYGIYFAPAAVKSIGYTSSRGSNYGHGNQDKGYLAIFKVATGTPYYIYRDGGYSKRPNNWNDFHKNHPEADCLWAERNNGDNGMRLRMDEVVIYQECQATIEYLIEFAA